MTQHYSDPSRAHDKWSLPDIETFRVTRETRKEYGMAGEDGEPLRCGWYWQMCMPGCLPDSDPFGPFRSEAAALKDARESMETMGDDQ